MRERARESRWTLVPSTVAIHRRQPRTWARLHSRGAREEGKGVWVGVKQREKRRFCAAYLISEKTGERCWPRKHASEPAAKTPAVLFSWRARVIGDAATEAEAARAGENERDAFLIGEKGLRAGEKRFAGDMPAKSALNASRCRRLGEAATHAARCGLRPCALVRPCDAGERPAPSEMR